jgi:hypothetical protein
MSGAQSAAAAEESGAAAALLLLAAPVKLPVCLASSWLQGMNTNNIASMLSATGNSSHACKTGQALLLMNPVCRIGGHVTAALEYTAPTKAAQTSNSYAA